MEKRILQLNLTKKWFDLIKAGAKKVEYREVKKHWISRLSDVGTIVYNDFSDIKLKMDSISPFINDDIFGEICEFFDFAEFNQILQLQVQKD